MTKKNSITDYFGYILLKIFGPLFRTLPIKAGFCLGRALGDLFYCLDAKHRLIAYANLKVAFGEKLSPEKLKKITRDFYRAFGQNIIEIFYIPLVNRQYLDRYIKIEGLNYIEEAFRNGKGVILLTVHAGSWELSNIICASLGFPFNLFVSLQRYPRLNRLLNFYRAKKGCRIIQRQNQTKQVIRALKNNEAIGMTIDQGGRTGSGVEFFGKDASMPTGAVRLALKYGASIIPAFYVRLNGPCVKVILKEPFTLKKTGEVEDDVRDNLQRIVRIFESLIAQYPEQYLWSYRIWKYSRQRKVLILSDAKAGHLRQSEAAAGIIRSYLKDKGFSSSMEIREAANPRDPSLSGIKPDIIISCGSRLAAVNLRLSRENQAKSVAIMRPPFLSAGRFDLLIIPRHDRPRPGKNVVVTEGALNLINDDYLKKQAEKLSQNYELGVRGYQLRIGLFIGGDTKNFRLGRELMAQVIRQVKTAAQDLGARLLITTSRRTSTEIEGLIKQEFNGYPACGLLVVANEKNIPEASGGILGLSEIIIVSPESISMVSEAASSLRYVVVFDAPGLDSKHRRFLRHLSENKYIYIARPQDLSRVLEGLWQNKPEINRLQDSASVAAALKRAF